VNSFGKKTGVVGFFPYSFTFGFAIILKEV